MTLISALISNKGVAVATDSMLSTVDSNGENRYLEWEKAKIVPIPKLRACLSYWGFAGLLRNVPKGPTDTEWKWQTMNWLSTLAVESKFDNLEDFACHLRDELDREMNKLKVNKHGIGIHITGIEDVDGYRIPELFLVSNYIDENYVEVGNLHCSRQTFFTISGDPPKYEHRNSDCRLAVNTFLNADRYIYYNNGDPLFFNEFAGSLFRGYSAAKDRGVVKRLESVQDTLPLVKFPIHAVSSFQRDFYAPGKRLIGGRIHDLCIADNGTMASSSGVV